MWSIIISSIYLVLADTVFAARSILICMYDTYNVYRGRYDDNRRFHHTRQTIFLKPHTTTIRAETNPFYSSSFDVGLQNVLCSKTAAIVMDEIAATGNSSSITGDIDASAARFSLVKSSRAGGPVTCVSLASSRSSLSNHQSNDYRDNVDAASEPVTFVFAAQGPYITRYSLVAARQPPHEEDRRLLVFPSGGTIHGIVFCSSREDGATFDSGSMQNLPWDSIVFGEDRLAFCNLRSSGNVLERFDVETSCNRNRTKCLRLTDWIWSIKVIASTSVSSIKGEGSCATASLVMGFGRHFIEIWKATSNPSLCETLVVANSLRRLYLSPSTVVTSMDSFYHQPQGRLYVVSGTSFHKIWLSSVILDTDTDALATESSKVKCLVEHAGVVHAVKFSSDGTALISCSDDRSVRWWVRDEVIQSYRQKWVGWGHCARVWSVSFATRNESLVVSASEDGTARIWCASSGVSLACIQYGAASCSLWAVDALIDSIVLGATDGVVSVYNVNDQQEGKNLQSINFISIPDDRSQIVKPPLYLAPENASMIEVMKKKAKKKKLKPQVIVGMKWWCYTRNEQVLLVATREGTLLYLDVGTRGWKYLNAWCVPSLSETHCVDPSDGCCMAVHPESRRIAFGTKKGAIVLNTIKEGSCTQYTLLDGHSLRSVQGLRWLSPSSLVSFHVSSVALWELPADVSGAATMFPSKIFKMETKGVALSCDHDPIAGRIVIGDSRGSLSLFSTHDFDVPRHSTSLSSLTKVHQKEHINDVRWLDSNTVLSAGNDGCLHISYIREDSFVRGWSFPAPSMTGVTKLILDRCEFPAAHSGVLVGGYYGNTFRMIDSRTGYESMQIDTEGRQRILDCAVEMPPHGISMPSNYSVAVCMGRKDGSNDILIQRLQQPHHFNNTLPSQNVALGVKLHGETVFGATIFTLQGHAQFLVTASEDCTTRISSLKDGMITGSLLLTPQSSCVRCVCSSQIDGSSVLLAIGGGKLTIQFFLVQASVNGESSDSVDNLKVIHLGNGRTTPKKGKAVLDQRMYCIDAVPLRDENREHLVVAGDSNGMLHFFVVSESESESYNSTIDIKLAVNPWPIVCIKALVVFGRALIVFGTTRGDITMVDLPTSPTMIRGSLGCPQDLWSPVCTFEGHGMGTNCIDIQISHIDKNCDIADLSVVTGGDDHSITVGRVTIRNEGEDCPISLVCDPKIQSLPGASFSALKSVLHLSWHGQSYLLSVGYSQTLCFWKLPDQGVVDIVLEAISSVPVDLGDVNCMAAHASSKKDSLEVSIAVCGMGVEMFRLLLRSC